MIYAKWGTQNVKNISIELCIAKGFLFHHQSTRPGSFKDCFAVLAIQSDEISDFRPNNSFGSIKFLGDVEIFFAIRTGLLLRLGLAS